MENLRGADYYGSDDPRQIARGSGATSVNIHEDTHDIHMLSAGIS